MQVGGLVFASNDITQHVTRTPPSLVTNNCATMEAELSVESCV